VNIFDDFDVLKTLFFCDFEKGFLVWAERGPKLFNDSKITKEQKAKLWNARFSGKQAFTALNSGGYYYGSIFGKMYLAHRILFALNYGAFPLSIIDHVDGNPLNNSIGNLRVCTRKQNAQNVGIRITNTSGFKGVSWHSPSSKFLASISCDGKSRHIGLFKTASDASIAYEKAAKELHGDFYHV
jgi:hypothetical protein